MSTAYLAADDLEPHDYVFDVGSDVFQAPGPLGKPTCGVQIAAESVEMFCRALAYNWVIYGPDAHAKNYSLLLSGRVVRLAPLYDISSVTPYPDRYDLPRMVMVFPPATAYGM